MTIGIAIAVLYGPAFVALLVASGVDYDDIAASADNMRNGIVIPLSILGLVLVALAFALRAWPALLSEPRTVTGPLRWLPVIWVVALIASLDYGRVGDLDTSFLFWTTIGVLLVGFCEEIVYRGYAIIGLRRGAGEVQVWLVSSLLFGLLHAWNAAAGQSVGATAGQVVLTFIIGSLLYVVRRTTGTLVVPVLLHAGWDWVLLTGQSDAFADAADARDPGGSAMLLFGLAMVVLAVIYRKSLFAVSETAQERTDRRVP